MRIAIYHNLKKGGALTQLNEFLARNHNDEIDIYKLSTADESVLPRRERVEQIFDNNNLFTFLCNVVFKIKAANYNIAKKIENGKYDVVLIFPCHLTQSPDIIRYIKGKSIYFFAERKREYYEITSYDYFNLKKALIRILLFPLRVRDYINCRGAKNIVANSVFSSYIIQKTYGKKSKLIYPGLKFINAKRQVKTVLPSIISVGQISYIKGHDTSINVLSKTAIKQITIIGRPVKGDYQYIKNLSKSHHIKLDIIHTESNRKKLNTLKQHGICLAMNRLEPFGITTLESASSSKLIVGINEGGGFRSSLPWSKWLSI